jgi:hypothetical protein
LRQARKYWPALKPVAPQATDYRTARDGDEVRHS